MLRARKGLALALLFVMLVATLAPAALAAPAKAATADQEKTAQSMVAKLEAYHEAFSGAEQAEIKASYDALLALTDGQWKTLVGNSGLKTAEFTAKYSSDAEAEAALTELLKDTFGVLYAVYNKDVLYDACLEFVVDQQKTIDLIFDGKVTQPMLVSLIEGTEKELAGYDISGSISDQASDYWNVVYGTGNKYIEAVDHVMEAAIEDGIAGSVLKTGMTALSWSTAPFAKLHEAVLALVDSDCRANTVIYDSILRKHSELINVQTGQEVADGTLFSFLPGQSVTLKFTIFGKNVSVPFGSYIKLPSNGAIAISVDQAANTFTVKGVAKIVPTDLELRRGVVGSDTLVNQADLMRSFRVSCSEAAPTPTDKKDYHPETPSPAPTEKPELSATVSGGNGTDKVEVKLEEKQKDTQYQLRMFINDEEVPEGTMADESYRISIVIPTGWKNTDNVILYYKDNEGNKVVLDNAVYKNGVLTADVRYVGHYYIEKTNLDILEENHIAYLMGDEQGHFNPDANMTRAEAAQMFYNLLKDKKVTSGVTFGDVDDGAWYATAVKTLASLKIICGYEGLYRPEDSITREEFTTVAVKFSDLTEEGSLSFTDVTENRWSYPYILTASSKGWISGYPDGSFQPSGFITRAEVASVVNRMLSRIPDEGYIREHGNDLKIFPDAADVNFWAYYQIVEATNAHDCQVSEKKETWTAVK